MSTLSLVLIRYPFLWSLVLKAAVGTYPIVLQPPDLRLRLSLGKCVKHLHVQKCIFDFGVKALDKAILPWFSPFDMDGVRTVCRASNMKS